MKTHDKKTRAANSWDRAEDRFLDELDRRLRYNWRDRCNDADDFYSSGSHYRTVIKDKERSNTLVCTV